MCVEGGWFDLPKIIDKMRNTYPSFKIRILNLRNKHIVTLLFLFQEIFRPPLDDYDVIIKLHCNVISRHCEAIDCSKPCSVSKGQRLESAVPVINFDPVQCYLRELKVCKVITLLEHSANRLGQGMLNIVQT